MPRTAVKIIHQIIPHIDDIFRKPAAKSISGTTPAILDRCTRRRGVVREDSLSLPYRWEVVNVMGRRGLVRILCVFGVRICES